MRNDDSLPGFYCVLLENLIRFTDLEKRKLLMVHTIIQLTLAELV